MKTIIVIKFLFLLIVLLTLTSIVSADKIDNKNELIMQKVLELDNITVSNIEISNSNIFVSIEVTEAMNYDAELIAYWGSIFGISAMLKNDDEFYSTVTIENLVDGEPYVYVSTNIISIQDYQNDMLEDYEFWEESLVTAQKPTTNDIVEGSNLPKETLIENNRSNSFFSIVKLWWFFIIIILLIIFFVYKNFSKIKTNNISKDNVKAKVISTKNYISDARKKISKVYDKKGKKIVSKTKKTIKTKSKQIAGKTKVLAGKTKKESIKFYNKAKKETTKKFNELKKAKGSNAKKK